MYPSFTGGDCHVGVAAPGRLAPGALAREVAGDFWLTDSFSGNISAFLNLTTGFSTFVYVSMICRGGLAFLFVPINVVAFSFVPKERMNSATGLINLARNIGARIGISLVTTMQARLAQKHQNDLIANLTPLNPRYLGALHGLSAGLQEKGSTACTAAKQAGAILYKELQRQAAMLAFIDVFWLLGIVCLAMIPLMFVIKSPGRQGESVPMH